MKETLCLCQGKSLPGVTMSIGVARYPLHGQTVKGVIRAADQALYVAKKAGRESHRSGVVGAIVEARVSLDFPPGKTGRLSASSQKRKSSS